MKPIFSLSPLFHSLFLNHSFVCDWEMDQGSGWHKSAYVGGNGETSTLVLSYIRPPTNIILHAFLLPLSPEATIKKLFL